MNVNGGQGDRRLHRVQAVTDAVLSRLDVSDLLDEFLDRVRDLLSADTAAVLLLESHSRQLLATAARGLEDEVRQGFRIPLGQGFAGRIAQSRLPLTIDHLTPEQVVNPVLVDIGIRSLLGVPIFAGGEVVGVLHVGTLTPRVFTSDDIHLLQLAADQAGIATQVRSRKLERAAALALQHSLLPARLPDVPGMDLAARYLPGHDIGVGGDWYDVFTLPSGWLGVVIGDVAGHGLGSAVIMGRIRSALRAYALVTEDPAQVLTLLDNKVRHFEAGNLTTALYALIAPDRATVHLSTAGHPPPVLVTANTGGTLVELPADPPLGISVKNPSRRVTTINLPPGATLVFYTDGLVERRGQTIDLGLEMLTKIVHPAPAETLCGTIMAGMGMNNPADDVALLVVHRPLVSPSGPPER